MEIVVFLFTTICIIGFISGLTAAISISVLSKYAVGAPRLLKLSGVSLLFKKYYPNHNKQRKVTLALEVICVACILLAFLVLIICIPEMRDLVFKPIGSHSTL
ncbi:hypothetical protein ACJJIR_03310 [Microbulbifer sp. SSSA008]|uniref:hypothetical protein n=1 Tax=Microbulbifer sp. SSSA008 TaxID=3243380 RepID=UPI0040390F1D